MAVVKYVLGVVFAFLLFMAGWQMNSMISYTYAQEVVLPAPESVKQFTFEREKPSPQDWIKENQIHVYSDKIVIDLANARWAKFTDTNSMDPVFDKGNNVIQIVPSSEKQLAVGDIITYQSKYMKDAIIHRIIEINNDEQGWYAIAKGDNNDSPDPGRIRFNQIKKVVVGVLY